MFYTFLHDWPELALMTAVGAYLPIFLKPLQAFGNLPLSDFQDIIMGKSHGCVERTASSH